MLGLSVDTQKPKPEAPCQLSNGLPAYYVCHGEGDLRDAGVVPNLFHRLPAQAADSRYLLTCQWREKNHRADEQNAEKCTTVFMDENV